MSKRSLIIGMGIGQLYKTVLEKLGHKVITVDQDISKGADFDSVDKALLVHGLFDTAHICTPNFTHFEIAARVAPHSKIVFIEKPGVATSDTWAKLVTEFKQTRFIMVKNNMWRSNIAKLVELASKAKTVKISWIRKNCIPSPGSWFTTKKLAFGGVSRDLMPHLLSLYVAMNPNWKRENISGQTAVQCWELKDIDSTDYGVVNPDGTYNVDDMCVINFGDKWRCEANWRSIDKEDSSIEFVMLDNATEQFDLGWCPEEAYHNMIVDAIDNMDNPEFWLKQYAVDTWIHERIENL
jgi:predicted dehydrogenase